MTLAALLKAHGDPIATAQALGVPVRAVPPASSVALTPLVSPTFTPATPMINVDRIATPVTMPAIAPAPSLSPAAPVTLAAAPASSSWLSWVKSHALWLLAALLVLLVLAHLAQRSKRPGPSGFRPSRMVKGSPEARAHMDRIRGMRKKK